MSPPTIEQAIRDAEQRRKAAERRQADAVAKAKALAERARETGRKHLDPAEEAALDELIAAKRQCADEISKADGELSALRAMRQEESEVAQQAADTHKTSAWYTRAAGAEPKRNPLAYSPAALDSIQASLDQRVSGRFEAAMQERAALATGTYGAPRAWGSNVLDGPRLLHMAAGVPRQSIDAIYAQFPQLTLPTAQAGVGENTSLPEYAASAAGSVTLARYGRWTDLSRESRIGTDAETIVATHTVGIALDLDSALVGAVDTAAGTAVAFTADVPAAIRKALAQVQSNTAAANVAQLVVLTHPDNVALLQDVAPVGGQTMAEGFSRFSGALVYPSSAVPTGFMIVGNLRSGVRYFEAQELLTESDVDIKTGTFSLATSVIAGYAIGLLGGAFIKVDVVTP